MAPVEQYSFDAHLREEDRQLFHHDPRSWQSKHIRARDDIVRDLKRNGYIDYDDLEYYDEGLYFFGEMTGTIVDDASTATVELEFSASGGSLTVPEGTWVYDADPAVDSERYGAVVFETDAALTVPGGQTDTVEATAEHPGEVYNVGPDVLTYPDASLSHFDGVTNAAAATGGADHQLARVSVYRALALIYRDLVAEEGDTFDYKRKLYEDYYHEELDRQMAAGIKIDVDGDGQANDHEESLEHGGVRLYRS